MESGNKRPRFRLTRRDFLGAVPPAAASVAASIYLPGDVLHFSHLQPIEPGTNPLAAYPNRDWEKVYRDLYTPDSQFHYMCAPNDTHGCLLKASVKNGVVVYADPSFGYGKAKDMLGNAASARWDPRICISGISYVRRFYSERRVKGPMIRKGFKAWVDAGFPRDPETGRAERQYFEGRGKEEFEKISWDEAFAITAKALVNISETYSGEDGHARLESQGYDPAMIEATEGAGTRTIKARGGMPLLGPIRIAGSYRYTNMMALLDAHVRGVGPDKALGARYLDSFSWHTDLPPGHPMVTGQQACDFDLFTAENSKLITLWGMNWIATKMPDGHWLTEAKLHGAKVVTIAPEYQSASSKADEVIVIRSGHDPALAMGLAHVIVKENLFDEAFVKAFTDLPLLVRMDNLKMLRARDVIAGYEAATLSQAKLMQPGEKPPPPAEHGVQYIPAAIRDEWNDFMVWDNASSGPKPVNREQVGTYFDAMGIDAALEGEFEVTLVSGETIRVAPNFGLVKRYLLESCDPETISKDSGAPVEAIENLARQIAENKTKTLFVQGMGPNHFFNNDLKDRAMFLVAALTNNVGHFGGTVGSYSGNYRLGYFAMGPYAKEDPFDIELDPAVAPRQHGYNHGESAHYYNYDDRPLRVGNKLFTGKTHMPSPTKALFWANSNSLLGNTKWVHNVVMNTLPKIELLGVNEYFWSGSCEYADIVFGVDSWIERQSPDIYASVSNPFLQTWPRSPLPRLHDTRDDVEVWAGIGAALGEETGDSRFKDYWHFIHEGKVETYINRIFEGGNNTRGYKFSELDATCKEGTPAYLASRTTPKVMGWEQTNESKPWYTKSGRLEFYREEDEFIEHGENLPVVREPVDGTHHEPNVILARPHPAIQPKGPDEYGLEVSDQSTEVRQVRNVMKTPEELLESEHPLIPEGYTHVLITPKYRHACHSTAGSSDLDVAFWGPFGDFYRHDKRKPWIGEGYIDLNPEDAAELGVEDGDYVWCDADPSDRPFVGHEDKPDDYKVHRWLVRARIYPSIKRGIGRAWFHFYMATYGSVEGHETREDGLARNPRTGYQAGYRYGSHQSITRAWLRPTLMTDSLIRKDNGGQVIGQGFEADVHCTVGAPKESFVRIEKAEPGGEDGKGQWDPLAKGYRPSNANEAMKLYLAGDFIEGSE